MTIIPQLRNSIVMDRLAHAYLFSGQPQSGKKGVAKALAKTLNCEQSRIEPCGVCSSCKKIENKNHPDVRWIFPNDETGSIKIEDIRALQTQVSLKPYEGRYKIHIIVDADTMTEAASNCLLKTLEEPQGETLLILTSSNTKMLLPTIISRCQVIKFPKSSGCEEGTSRNEVIDRFTDATWQGEELDENLWIFDKERHEVEDALYILASWFRDILVLRCGVSPSILMNPYRKDEIMELSKKYSVENLLNILDTVEKTRLLISQNANIKIAIPVMLININKEKYQHAI